MFNDYLILKNGDISCPLHINPELEVVYVKKGNVTVNSENRINVINPGEAIVIFPYHLHGFSPSEDAEALVFMFSFSLAEEIYKTFYAKTLSFENFSLSLPESEYVNCCLEDISDKFKVRSLFFMFISSFLKQNTAFTESNNETKLLQNIVKYIYDNITEEIKMESVAQAVGINRTAVCKIFSKGIGITFHKFLQNIRIEKAKSLLHGGEKNVTQISFECGFGSVRSFNRAFLEQVGCTPREYKNGKCLK